MLQLENIELERGGFSLGLEGWQASGGEFHALLGRNGAGKSTLLKLVAGEVRFCGAVRLHGRLWQDWDSAARARHLAVLPQASQLSFAFTAGEVVALGATPLALGWRQLQQEIRRTMALACCETLVDKPYPRLSGGQKQRVHLARVLLQLSQAEQAPLLLLDEPTSAQDLGQQHSVLETARALAHDRGYGVVAVLHDLNQALRYADRCSLLDAGRIVREGRPDAVLTPDCVQAFWDYPAEYARCDSGQRHIV